MDRFVKLAFWVWTIGTVSLFVLAGLDVGTHKTCGALSPNPCPGLEMGIAFAVLLFLWVIGISVLGLIYLVAAGLRGLRSP